MPVRLPHGSRHVFSSAILLIGLSMAETRMILGIKTLYLICQLISSWSQGAGRRPESCHGGELTDLTVLDLLLCATDSAPHLNASHLFFIREVGKQSQRSMCRLCRPCRLYGNSPALPSKHKSSHRQYTNQCAWLCPDKTLLRGMDF